MKRNIYLMYAIAFLQGMVFYGPVATLYRQAQGVSVFQITLIESISLILCILLEVVWGVIADKIGYKRTMVLCCALYFLSKIIFWQASGFAGFLAGLLAAAAVFSLFVREDYRLLGLLTVISYGLAAVLSLALTDVSPEGSRRISREGFRQVLSQTMCDRNLLLFLVGAAFLNETHQTVTVFLNQLQYEKCGLGNAAIGSIYIGATLLGMCGPVSAWFTKRAGIRAAGTIFGGAAVLSCLTMAVSGSALPSVCGILALRVSNSLFQPFQAEMQNRQVRTEYRATALSIHAMLLDGIGAGTNLAFGALAERNLAAAFLFGAGICAVGTGLFLKWCRNRPCYPQSHQKYHTSDPSSPAASSDSL